MDTIVPVVTSDGSTSIYSENLDQCIKSATHLWETVYTNICDGTTYSIANGFWDLALYSVLIGFFLFGALFMLKVIFD